MPGTPEDGLWSLKDSQPYPAVKAVVISTSKAANTSSSRHSLVFWHSRGVSAVILCTPCDLPRGCSAVLKLAARRIRKVSLLAVFTNSLVVFRFSLPSVPPLTPLNRRRHTKQLFRIRKARAHQNPVNQRSCQSHVIHRDSKATQIVNSTILSLRKDMPTYYR